MKICKGCQGYGIIEKNRIRKRDIACLKCQGKGLIVEIDIGEWTEIGTPKTIYLSGCRDPEYEHLGLARISNAVRACEQCFVISLQWTVYEHL